MWPIPFCIKRPNLGKLRLCVFGAMGKVQLLGAVRGFSKVFGHGFMMVYGPPISMSGEIPASWCQPISKDPVFFDARVRGT